MYLTSQVSCKVGIKIQVNFFSNTISITVRFSALIGESIYYLIFFTFSFKMKIMVLLFLFFDLLVGKLTHRLWTFFFLFNVKTKCKVAVLFHFGNGVNASLADCTLKEITN